MSITEAWQIAVNAPLFKNLTYAIPSELKPQERQIALLPLKKHQAKGVLIAPASPVSDAQNQNLSEIKEIQNILFQGWQIPSDYFQWAQWISDFYVYPLGLVLEHIYSMFPEKPVEKKSRRLVKRPFTAPSSTQPLNHLTQEQEAVFKKINSFHTFSIHLLDGVTGSGKTEIYLHLFDQVIKNSGQGLFLVPEISLTPQMIQRFSRVFGNAVAVWHSQLTPRQKYETWMNIQNQTAKILIGARSALFCSIPNLRLIVLDEEHDSSFKQDSKLRYHARPCAIKLAELKNIPIVLGSATPSLETFHQVKIGRCNHYQLKNRVKTELPSKIEIVDLKEAKKNPIARQLPHWLSPQLYQKIAETLKHNNQVALFLNRRGFASLIFCNNCGYHEECPDCSVPLTLHSNSMMFCHYCGYHSPIPQECPSCREGSLTPFGLGTEQIELDLKRLFPEKNTIRIDRDEVSNLSDLEKALTIFQNNDAQILVGTQMIAKGLDFPRLRLVGFVLADVGFHIPDFRATERACQLLFQMSGRAGRHATDQKSQGEIIIQTYQPNNGIFLFLKEQNYNGFLEQEFQNRKELSYPPFSRMGLILLEHSKLEVVKQDAFFCKKIIDYGVDHFKQLHQKIRILGPTEAPISKIRRKFRYHLILLSPRSIALSSFFHWIVQQYRDNKRVSQMHIDIDPYQLL
ncbi:MAG: primosomal protein N' [Bdellovibrionaceae bacterium]|nr:primosomal protein N' [Pseudobdellovibrionaceae bacterium]MDW8189759.1 primosomal protein N' [Pseudobdellovibrionaceae bacterium]